MRIALFLICLSMLLLGGGTTVHAAIMQPFQINTIHTTLTKNHQIKFYHKDQDSDLIEDADTDTEDDGHYGANDKTTTNKKLAAFSNIKVQPWYHAFVTLDVQLTILPIQNYQSQFCGYSSPTFSRLQVLRI